MAETEWEAKIENGLKRLQAQINALQASLQRNLRAQTHPSALAVIKSQLGDLLGTANQVIVSNGEDCVNKKDDVTLSLPQNIHTAASPTFAGLTITGLTGIIKAVAGVLSGDAAIANLSDYTGWIDYSATSTIVGFSGFTTKTIYYLKIGKQVFVTFYLDGTSDAITLTFTVPTASEANVNFYESMARGINNGVALATPCRVQLPASSSTVTISTNLTGTGWTAANQKLVVGQLWYVSA